MGKSDGNVANPFFALSKFGVDAMRFYFPQKEYITDGGDDDVRTVITNYKKGCVDGLGNLAGRICRWKFDLERAVKRRVESSL